MRKKIAIVGAGAVGSTWAVSLVRAGHEVTLIARGSRLARLQQDGNAIYSRGNDEKAEPIKIPVSVTTALDPSQPWDLVFVSILAHQLDERLLATLRECRSTTQILFFFNTFTSLDSYYQAVGADRTLIGFPAVWASVEKDGTLLHTFPGASEILDPTWHAVFLDAGIPCNLQKDMQSWLRTHAATQVGFLSVVVPTGIQDRGATWMEAYNGSRVAHEAAKLVQELGNQLTPRHQELLFRLPVFVLAMLHWIGSRVPTVRKRTQASNRWRDELMNLSDAMIKEAPSPDHVQIIRQLRAKY